MLVCSCKRPLEKVMSRFKDGSVALVYDYPDKSDTSTYTYIEYFSNGNVHKMIPIKSNRIVNYPKWYYPNGKIIEIDSLAQPGDWPNLTWNGKSTKYYENGMKTVSEVKNGLREGLSEVFDTNGKPIKEYYLVNDSIKSGPYTEFYPDGKVSVRGKFENNLLEGMMYFFDEAGGTVKYYKRVKGEIFMPYKQWLPDGRILLGTYGNNEGTVVVWRWLTKNGKNIKTQVQTSKDRTFGVPQ